MAEITIQPCIDSGMNGYHPDTNYGASTGTLDGVIFLGEEKTDLWRAIANFDVSQLAGAVINDAKLVRQITYIWTGNHPATIYRCTKPALWTEGGVTWNKYDGASPWDNAGGDYDASTPTPISFTEPGATGEHEIADLNAFVEDALDYRDAILSIIIRADDEAPPSSKAVQWATRESSTPEHRWYLVVTYEPIIARPRRATAASEGGRRPRQPRTPLRAAVPRPPWRGRRTHAGRRPTPAEGLVLSPAEGRKPWAP